MHALTAEPGAGYAPMLEVIRSARHDIRAEVYYFADRPLLKALADARARGVHVEVIVEGKPYGIRPWQVRREEKAIQATGATLRLAPERFTSHDGRYAFDHAKYICNNHACEIGTANFDWSAFHKNREYLYVTSNPTVVKAANAVFEADWNNRRAPAYAHQTLVLSPGTSAAQLVSVIDQPGPIEMESEELGAYRPVLNAIAAKGRQAYLILPSSLSRTDLRNVAFLKTHGVHIRLMPKQTLFLHAKMIAGRQAAFIGSENFTQTSLEVNREMGLILGERAAQSLSATFSQDWKQASPS